MHLFSCQLFWNGCPCRSPSKRQRPGEKHSLPQCRNRWNKRRPTNVWTVIGPQICRASSSRCTWLWQAANQSLARAHGERMVGWITSGSRGLLSDSWDWSPVTLQMRTVKSSSAICGVPLPKPLWFFFILNRYKQAPGLHEQVLKYVRERRIRNTGSLYSSRLTEDRSKCARTNASTGNSFGHWRGTVRTVPFLKKEARHGRHGTGWTAQSAEPARPLRLLATSRRQNMLSIDRQHKNGTPNPHSGSARTRREEGTKFRWGRLSGKGWTRVQVKQPGGRWLARTSVAAALVAIFSHGPGLAPMWAVAFGRSRCCLLPSIALRPIQCPLARLHAPPHVLKINKLN